MGIKKVVMCKDEETYESLAPSAEAIYITPEEDPDAVPTEGSSNTVTSGGVYEATKQLQENINSVEEDLGVLSADVKNHKDIYEGKIHDLYTRTNGLGGYLTGYNFGTAYPTQQELTDYAMEQIPNAIVDTDIFNQTKVVNLYDNHIWILTNTPDSDPVVFEWVDKGTEAVADANNDGLHGLVAGSNEEYRGHVEADGTISINGLESKLNELDQKDTEVNEAFEAHKNEANENIARLDDEILVVDTRVEETKNDLTALKNKTNNFITEVSGETKTRIFRNVVANFIEDNTYSAFKGRAFIPIENFGNFSAVVVVLNPNQEYDNYLRAHGDTTKVMLLNAPVTTNGGFYLFRTSTGSYTIPAVIVYSVPAVGVNFNKFSTSLPTYTIKNSSGENISSGTFNRVVYLPSNDTYTLTVSETATTYPLIRKFTVGDTAFVSNIEEEINPVDMTPGKNKVPTTGDDSPYLSSGYSNYFNISYDANSNPTGESFVARYKYPGYHRNLTLNHTLRDGDILSYSVKLFKEHGNYFNAAGQNIIGQDTYFKIFIENTEGSTAKSDFGFTAEGDVIATNTLSPGLTVCNQSPFNSILQPVLDAKSATSSDITLPTYDIQIIRSGSRYYILAKYSTDEKYVLTQYVDIINSKLNQKLILTVSGIAKNSQGVEYIFDDEFSRVTLVNKGVNYANSLIEAARHAGNYTKVMRLPINIYGNYETVIEGNKGLTTNIGGDITKNILEITGDVKLYANTADELTTSTHPFVGFVLTDRTTGNIVTLGLQDQTNQFSSSLSTGNGYVQRLYMQKDIHTDPVTGEVIYSITRTPNPKTLNRRNISNPINLKLKLVVDGDTFSLYNNDGEGDLPQIPQLVVNLKKFYQTSTTAGGYTWAENQLLYPGNDVSLGVYSFGDLNPVAEFTNLQFNVIPKN